MKNQKWTIKTLIFFFNLATIKLVTRLKPKEALIVLVTTYKYYLVKKIACDPKRLIDFITFKLLILFSSEFTLIFYLHLGCM